MIFSASVSVAGRFHIRENAGNLFYYGTQNNETLGIESDHTLYSCSLLKLHFYNGSRIVTLENTNNNQADIFPFLLEVGSKLSVIC